MPDAFKARLTRELALSETQSRNSRSFDTPRTGGSTAWRGSLPQTPSPPLRGGGGGDAAHMSERVHTWMSEAQDADGVQHPSGRKAVNLLADVRGEAWMLLDMAGPLVVQNTLSYGLAVVGTAALGHLGSPSALSAAVLANSVFNVLGLSLMSGLASAMETLCGQAYGACAYRSLGEVLQRALLVCWLACVPVSILWLHVGPLLSALGIGPTIAGEAAAYLAALVPSLYMAASVECVKRYLLAQRVVVPGTVVSLVTVALSPLFYWGLMYRAGMGLMGAAWAFNLSQATLLCGFVGYTAVRDARMRHDPRSTWGGVGVVALQGWGVYLSYALPAAAMLCVEWWVYEVVIFMAGWLPDADVAVGVMGLCFQVSACVFMIALAIGTAVNTRVANHLGRGAGGAARAAFLAGAAIVATQQAAVAGGVVAARHTVVGLLTNSDVVREQVLRVLPALVASFVGDGLNSVLSGVLRGAGRQGLGAALNVCGYWLVGLPLAWLLGFKLRLGALGFWIGLATTSSLQSMLLSAVVLSFDWGREVARSQALLRRQGLCSADEVDALAGGGPGKEPAVAEEGGEEEEDAPLLAPRGAGPGTGSDSISPGSAGKRPEAARQGDDDDAAVRARATDQEATARAAGAPAAPASPASARAWHPPRGSRLRPDSEV